MPRAGARNFAYDASAESSAARLPFFWFRQSGPRRAAAVAAAAAAGRIRLRLRSAAAAAAANEAEEKARATAEFAVRLLPRPDHAVGQVKTVPRHVFPVVFTALVVIVSLFINPLFSRFLSETVTPNSSVVDLTVICRICMATDSPIDVLDGTDRRLVDDVRSYFGVLVSIS